MSDRHNKVLQELLLLQAETGVIQPERVVSFAANPDTALHSEFEWDDTVAAHAHRLWQARQIIRIYPTIIPNESNEPIRMFLNVVENEDRPRGYLTTAEALADPELRREFLLKTLARLEGICLSYPIRELSGIRRAIERTRKTI